METSVFEIQDSLTSFSGYIHYEIVVFSNCRCHLCHGAECHNFLARQLFTKW